MTVIIRLSDEQATALEAKAAAEGLTVEQWIAKLAETGTPRRRVTPAQGPTLSPRCKPPLTATLTLSRSVTAFPCVARRYNAVTS